MTESTKALFGWSLSMNSNSLTLIGVLILNRSGRLLIAYAASGSDSIGGGRERGLACKLDSMALEKPLGCDQSHSRPLLNLLFVISSGVVSNSSMCSTTSNEITLPMYPDTIVVATSVQVPFSAYLFFDVEVLWVPLDLSRPR